MTRDEYYAILKERYKQVDKTSRESLHAYNEFKRELIHQVYEEEDHANQNPAPAHERG